MVNSTQNYSGTDNLCCRYYHVADCAQTGSFAHSLTLYRTGFVFVPLLAHYILGEQLHWGTFAGAALICAGVWVSVLQ